MPIMSTDAKPPPLATAPCRHLIVNTHTLYTYTHEHTQPHAHPHTHTHAYAHNHAHTHTHAHTHPRTHRTPRCKAAAPRPRVGFAATVDEKEPECQTVLCVCISPPPKSLTGS